LKYYLVKYNAACDYGFTVNGNAVVSHELWLNLISDIGEIKNPFNIALGTNQEVYYEDGIDLIQDFDIEELNANEAYIFIDKLIFNDVEYIEDINKILETDFLVESGIFPDIFKLISTKD
jgi:hypothetical protein